MVVIIKIIAALAFFFLIAGISLGLTWILSSTFTSLDVGFFFGLGTLIVIASYTIFFPPFWKKIKIMAKDKGKLTPNGLKLTQDSFYGVFLFLFWAFLIGIIGSLLIKEFLISAIYFILIIPCFLVFKKREKDLLSGRIVILKPKEWIFDSAIVVKTTGNLKIEKYSFGFVVLGEGNLRIFETNEQAEREIKRLKSQLTIKNNSPNISI